MGPFRGPVPASHFRCRRSRRPCRGGGSSCRRIKGSVRELALERTGVGPPAQRGRGLEAQPVSTANHGARLGRRRSSRHSCGRPSGCCHLRLLKPSQLHQALALKLLLVGCERASLRERLAAEGARRLRPWGTGADGRGLARLSIGQPRSKRTLRPAPATPAAADPAGSSPVPLYGSYPTTVCQMALVCNAELVLWRLLAGIRTRPAVAGMVAGALRLGGRGTARLPGLQGCRVRVLPAGSRRARNLLGGTAEPERWVPAPTRPPLVPSPVRDRAAATGEHPSGRTGRVARPPWAGVAHQRLGWRATCVREWQQFRVSRWCVLRAALPGVVLPMER